MILRRVIDHFRKQEWTAIVIDFVIVVVGVFVGIQVSNWNAAAIERRSEQQYLVQLRHDLVLIERQVREQVEFEKFQSRMASEVFTLMQEPGAPGAAEKIGVGLTQLTMRRTLKVESATFIDLQSSGNLEIISDPGLRAAIIGYFFTVRRFEAAIDKNNLTFVDTGYNDFLRRENVPYRNWDDALMATELPGSVRMRAADPDYQRATNGALFDPVRVPFPQTPGLNEKIIAHLSWRVGAAASNENLAAQMLSAASDLKARLDAQLGSASGAGAP